MRSNEVASGASMAPGVAARTVGRVGVRRRVREACGRGRVDGLTVVVYLVVQATLLVLAAQVRAPTRSVLGVAIVALGAAALVVGVARQRPRPIFGWWIVVVGAGLDLIATVMVAAVRGVHPGPVLSVMPLGIVVGLVPLPLAVGLALVARRLHGEPADLLDVMVATLGFFLLMWAFLIDRALDSGRDSGRSLLILVFPIGSLLLFAVAASLILGGGLRVPALRVTLLSVAALLGASMTVVASVSQPRSSRADDIVATLLQVHGALLGAVGLLRSLGSSWRRSRPAPSVSLGRIFIYAAVAVLVPLALAAEMSFGRSTKLDVVGFWVQVAVSTVFLLLLVIRQGLMARVAQRWAADLQQKSVALSTAMSEQTQLQHQLTYRAMHDPLTGLSNRIVLTERMEWSFGRGTGQPHTLMLLDLDRFKDINDTLGHVAGDELLIEISQRLLGAVPPGATLARLGGDEFAVFIEDTARAGAHRVAERILDTVRRSCRVVGREVYITTSIGVLVTNPAEGNPTPSNALGDADLALYAAKEAGRNKAVVFHQELRATRTDYARISSGLRHALVHEEFVLHYQAIIDLGTRTVVAVEALLRWESPGGRLIAPLEFIPAAEDSGLIVPIGAWVLRQACRDARRWYQDHHVAVSVNVSGRQLLDDSFARMVLSELANAGLPGQALIVEITETTIVSTAASGLVSAQLRRLREHGVRVAVDDFGTGYSSLSYVAELPIDIVKIDKSFIQPRGEPYFGPQDWAFTRAILQLVESLGMLAIVEGVETSEQADVLRTLNCPLVQGYLFAKPVPAAVIDQTLDVSTTLLTDVALARPVGVARFKSHGH